MIDKLLGGLVGIKSVYPDERRLALHAARMLEGSGFSVRLHEFRDGRLNVLATRGRGGTFPMFYGHLDTVPVYGDWKTDPFKLTQKGDRLFGLGACDMKGGIAAALHVATTLKDRKMKILLCSGEENISEGAWSAAERRHRWFKDVSFIVSGEPGASSASTGGSDMVTLGRRGRVTLRVEVVGKSAHGALAEMGVNAIEQASRIAAGLRGMKLLRHPLLGRESIFVCSISGGASGLSVPERASLELSFHIVPPTTIQGARSRVEQFIKGMLSDGRLDGRTSIGVTVKSRETPYMTPFVDSKSNPAVKTVADAVRRVCGRVVVNYASSVGDDNVFATRLRLPVIIVGPRGGNIHSSNEWVSRSDLERVAEVYGLVFSETV